MKAKWVNIVDSLPRNVDGRAKTDISRNREIDRSNIEPTYRHIEISRNRYIEGEKKRIKQTINIKQYLKQ